MTYIRRQIDEIQRDPVLRYYGAALAVLHVLTFLWWMDQRAIAILHREAEPICWPLFQDCHRLRVLPPGGVLLVLVVYLGWAVAAAGLFLSPARARAGYWTLLGLNVLKVAIMLLDFRLRMNQHYMAFAVSFVFFFVPGKRDAIRVLVTLFYCWAGTLKLNWEWISGGGLYRPLWLFTGVGVIGACIYVIVLELVVSWGLLVRRGVVFWAAFAQILNFHLFSWAVVGFFYPLLMLAILSIFPMCRWPLVSRVGAEPEPGDVSTPSLLATVWAGRAQWGTYVTAVGFSLLQLTPHAFPGDRAITGEGRLYALHMFDARTVCEGYATLRGTNGEVTRRDLKLAFDTRTACDPVVYYNRARNLCRRRDQAEGAFHDLDLYLWARRSTEPALRPVIAIEGFCAKGVRYSPLWHNEWIRAD